MLEAMTSERADNVQHVDTLVQRLQQFDDSAQVRGRYSVRVYQCYSIT